MVRVKLPKIFRRVLHPKRKSSSSSSHGDPSSTSKTVGRCGHDELEALLHATSSRSTSTTTTPHPSGSRPFLKVLVAEKEEGTESSEGDGRSPASATTATSTPSSDGGTSSSWSSSSFCHTPREEGAEPRACCGGEEAGRTPRRSNGEGDAPFASLKLNDRAVSPLEPDEMVGSCHVDEEDGQRERTVSLISKMSSFDVTDTPRHVEPCVVQGGAADTASLLSSSSNRRVKLSESGRETSPSPDAISGTSLENITQATEASQGFVSPEFYSKDESIEIAAENRRDILSKACSSPSQAACHLNADERGESAGYMATVFESPTDAIVREEAKKLSPIVPTKRDQGSERHRAKVESPEQSTDPTSDAVHSEPHAVPTSHEKQPIKETIQFFILILCPTSRIFELIQISASDATQNESTVDDVLKLIPQRCTDERLTRKKYVGFVRPDDGADFADPNARAFDDGDSERDGPSSSSSVDNNVIRENDVLVAVLEDHTGRRMSRISRPILRNSKFRSMMRRRRRTSGRGKGDNESTASKRSMRSSRRRSGRRSKHGDSTSSRTKRAVPVVSCVPENFDWKRDESSSVISGASLVKAAGAKVSSYSIEGSNDGKGNNGSSSLCQKLKHLSKKLHDVDDKFMAGDVSTVGEKFYAAVEGGSADTAVRDMAGGAADETLEIDVEEVLAAAEANFEMTPNMVADEITAHIGNIFADHDVEVVAIDEEDDDDDTFATARSRRSCRSVRSSRSVRSLARYVKPPVSVRNDEGGKPLLEIATKKKKPRKSRPSTFESYEDGDMMLQIEAMARQADAAFESRKRVTDGGGRGIAGTNIIEPDLKSAIVRPKVQFLGERVVEEKAYAAAAKLNSVQDVAGSHFGDDNRNRKNKVHQGSVLFDNKDVATPDNVLSTMETGKRSPDREPNLVENAISTQTATGLSQDFLNASTSLVSTVANASHGCTNEVHVLQYLGITIVCIAANLAKQQQGSGGLGMPNFKSPGGGPNPFRVKEVFQSAMFLAFMVRGQGYLAKVTKKYDR